eukprot:gene18652-22267_t
MPPKDSLRRISTLAYAAKLPSEYLQGSKVYAWDNEKPWQVGEVVNVRDDELEVLVDGLMHTYAAKDVVPASARARTGVDDMSGHGSEGLDTLHESALLDNIRVRFERDNIYTYCSQQLLVSINPYARLPIFDSENLKRYASQHLTHTNVGNLPPHLFDVAEGAFNAIAESKEPHAILISGESGAGKTESTKYLLRYLIERSAEGQNETGKNKSIVIERRIIESNALLEAFGNAKTERNDNSSRFGKYFTLDFDKECQLIGAEITTYLLEKSRVTSQQPGERNFHIFYQLCKGTSAEERDELGLLPAEDFFYLAQSECTEIEDVDDALQFKEVRESMQTFGFSTEEMKDLFRVLSAILQLGNLCFEDDEEGRAVLVTPAVMENAARLLKVTTPALHRALTERGFTGGRRTSMATVPLDTNAAIDSSNALARVLYSNIFTWLVRRINNYLKGDNVSRKHSSIGVLDIFGFECFQVNSFEQLCINYANEKLHQQFLKPLCLQKAFFKTEIADFITEGLEMSDIHFQ